MRLRFLQIEISQAGTPLTKFYSNFSKIQKKNQLKQMSGKDRLDNYDLPEITRKISEKSNVKEKKGFSDVFGSDDNSDDDNDEERLVFCLF